MLSPSEARIRTYAMKGLVADTDVNTWHRLVCEARAQLDWFSTAAQSPCVDFLAAEALRRCHALADFVQRNGDELSLDDERLVAAKNAAASSFEEIRRAATENRPCGVGQ